MGVGCTALSMISTPGEIQTSLFQQLLKSPIFRSIIIRFVCAPCFAKGVRTICKHKYHEKSPWMGENEEIISVITGGDTNSRQRDMLGVFEHTDTPQCFPTESIDAFFSAPRIKQTNPVRFVFMSIEPPSAGTDNSRKSTSDFAIVSISGPGTVIVGIDAIDAIHPSDWEVPLRRHIARIRAMPMYANCVIVADVEANGSSVWGHINAVIREFDRVIIVSDYNRKEGTNTTNSAKQEMVQITREVLGTGDDVRFLDGFVTSHPDPNGYIFPEFKRQMCAYTRVFFPTTSNDVAVFSGNGKNKDMKDDMCLTFQRALRRRKLFFNLQ